MHHRLLLAGFLLLAGLLPFMATGLSPVSTTPSAEAMGTVRYEVRYKLGLLDTRVATATISWEEAAWHHAPAFHSVAIVRPTPAFRLFISSDYYVETYFGKSNLSPLYFVNPFKSGGKDGKYVFEYKKETGTIESTTVYGDNDPICKTFPLDGKTFDLLSLLHFVRFLDLSKTSFPLPLKVLMANNSYPGHLIYQGIDKEKFPGTPTEKLLVQLPHGLMENGSGNELHLWRATTPDRRILALETPLSTGSMSCRISQE